MEPRLGRIPRNALPGYRSYRSRYHISKNCRQSELSDERLL